MVSGKILPERAVQCTRWLLNRRHELSLQQLAQLLFLLEARWILQHGERNIGLDVLDYPHLPATLLPFLLNELSKPMPFWSEYDCSLSDVDIELLQSLPSDNQLPSEDFFQAPDMMQWLLVHGKTSKEASAILEALDEYDDWLNTIAPFAQSPLILDGGYTS